jgi:peroxiredoxin
MTSTRHLATALGALAITLAAAFLWQAAGSKPLAPDVGYTGLDGRGARLSDLRGKVVLVNFWATTCAVCVREMPQIVATHRKYQGPAFDTLAVAMAYDPPARVVNFAHTRQLPFTVAIDNLGEIARGFGDVPATPTTVLLNKRGEVVRRIVGEPDFPALHRLIEELVAET